MTSALRLAVQRCCSPISSLLVHYTWSERRGGHYSPYLFRADLSGTFSKAIVTDNRGIGMLKAVLFDLDGTLVDSEPLHTEAVLRLLRDRSVDLKASDLDRFIGISSSVMWGEMRERFGFAEPVESLKSLQHRANVEMLEDSESILIPGVLPLLRDLRDRGIRSAVASSSTRDYIETVLSKYELDSLFDVVVSGEEVPRGKPRPDVFLRAAELLGVEPGSCVVIEDSDNGLTAAREAGIRSIGFRNPNSGRQALSLADRIVDDIREVSVALLQRLVD